MLDIKFLRENPEIVKQNIRNKFQDKKLPLVDEVIELDAENRSIKQEVEALRADRNKFSKQIGGLMAKGDKEGAEKMKAEVAKYAIQEEDVLTYAMFPQVAPKFFEKRNARLQGVDAQHADYKSKSHPV